MIHQSTSFVVFVTMLMVCCYGPPIVVVVVVCFGPGWNEPSSPPHAGMRIICFKIMAVPLIRVYYDWWQFLNKRSFGAFNQNPAF
jgi:hypothetical protein